MTEQKATVRNAKRSDVSAINQIYNGYIVGSHVSFDTSPWTDVQRQAWFDEKASSGFPVFVAERGEGVIGAAWAGPWRLKPAYASTAETTVVLDPDAHGTGVGTAVYGALLSELRRRSFHRCYAIIALPNTASVALHRKLGFTNVGVLDEVGEKDGKYVSTLLMENHLNAMPSGSP